MERSFSRIVFVLSVAVIIVAISLPAEHNKIKTETLEGILKEEAVHRLKQLGKISDSNEYLERTFLSPAALKSGMLIAEWMEDAGLRIWIDQMGNVHGRTEGKNSSEPALLIGSHLDTVIDAGMYDGALGIVCAVAAIKALKITGQLQELPRPVEVIAFSDEEGVRFHSTFLGSAAIAGRLPVDILNTVDKRGLTLQSALRENSFDSSEESIRKLKYDPSSVWGYVEVHIEQGPVLERHGLPLGIVEGIAGQTRLKVTINGSQGHAGTVPMSMRNDPMPAAAEAILNVESLCKFAEEHFSGTQYFERLKDQLSEGSLVCTVGEIANWPCASNVIPGQVVFTIDVRAKEDDARKLIISEMYKKIHQICDKRSLSCTIERKHDASAAKCHEDMISRLHKAAKFATQSLPIIRTVKNVNLPFLMSGAGHDAMAMSHLTKVGMIFVRCAGGISHSPLEHVTEDDIWAASLSLVTFLQDL